MAKAAATHYPVQLGLQDKGRAIKESVVCWLLLNLCLNINGEIWLQLVILGRWNWR